MEAVIETLEAERKTVSVAFEEVPAEMWKEKVYVPDIIIKKETLTKKPGYNLD